MYFLTENWDTWYPGGADSESGLRHLKFRSPDLFWGGEGGGEGGKFVLQKSKLFFLSANWHTCYLGSANSESGIIFLKFRHQT